MCEHKTLIPEKSDEAGSAAAAAAAAAHQHQQQQQHAVGTPGQAGGPIEGRPGT